MRALALGEPFTDVPGDAFVPDEDDLQEMRDDLDQAFREGRQIPTFSEAYLYPRLGKSDARFVLAVVEEYGQLIKLLGTDKVKELLGG